jgi:hypothetical protein
MPDGEEAAREKHSTGADRVARHDGLGYEDIHGEAHSGRWCRALDGADGLHGDWRPQESVCEAQTIVEEAFDTQGAGARYEPLPEARLRPESTHENVEIDKAPQTRIKFT